MENKSTVWQAAYGDTNTSHAKGFGWGDTENEAITNAFESWKQNNYEIVVDLKFQRSRVIGTVEIDEPKWES